MTLVIIFIYFHMKSTKGCYINLLNQTRRVIDDLPLISYVFHTKLDTMYREMITTSFTSTTIWQRINSFSEKWISLVESSASIDHDS